MAKILAVDDEPAILEMIESILNKDGHLVTKVSNPLKINMEELHRYDLILLDIMMPGIDGFELCKRIRALVDCPILFLTAKTEENSLVNGLSLGADDYISKPFGVMELRARINAHDVALVAFHMCFGEQRVFSQRLVTVSHTVRFYICFSNDINTIFVAEVIP